MRGGSCPLALPRCPVIIRRSVSLPCKRRAAQAARPAGDIFSYGKTLSPLDNSPFWMYPYIKQDTCISIRTLFLSRCPGSLSEHSICREPSLTQEFSSAVLFSLIRGKIWSYSFRRLSYVPEQPLLAGTPPQAKPEAQSKRICAAFRRHHPPVRLLERGV